MPQERPDVQSRQANLDQAQESGSIAVYSGAFLAGGFWRGGDRSDKKPGDGSGGRQLTMRGQGPIVGNNGVIRKDTSMHRFALKTSLFIAVLSLAGCSSGAYNMATLDKEEAGNAYCNKKLQPVGPSDLARPTQSRSGDFIDYSGPCDGPSIKEQTRQQKRFEQFRFGRDYMDEG
jgi:hypothetical protein